MGVEERGHGDYVPSRFCPRNAASARGTPPRTYRCPSAVDLGRNGRREKADLQRIWLPFGGEVQKRVFHLETDRTELSHAITEPRRPTGGREEQPERRLWPSPGPPRAPAETVSLA